MEKCCSAAGSASALNCGLVRERGTVRTSTTISMACSCRSAMNSSMERVEWPMVKTVAMAASPDTRAPHAALNCCGMPIQDDEVSRRRSVLERDSFRLNRYPALDSCWRMIFSENRYPLFGIMRLALPASAAADQTDDDQQQNRTNGGIDDGADDAGAERDPKPRQQPGGDEGADNADDDVADQPETRTLDDLSGEPAGDEADQEDDDDALVGQIHESTLGAWLNGRSGEMSVTVRGVSPHPAAVAIIDFDAPPIARGIIVIIVVRPISRGGLVGIVIVTGSRQVAGSDAIAPGIGGATGIAAVIAIRVVEVTGLCGRDRGEEGASQKSGEDEGKTHGTLQNPRVEGKIDRRRRPAVPTRIEIDCSDAPALVHPFVAASHRQRRALSCPAGIWSRA